MASAGSNRNLLPLEREKLRLEVEIFKRIEQILMIEADIKKTPRCLAYEEK